MRRLILGLFLACVAYAAPAFVNGTNPDASGVGGAGAGDISCTAIVATTGNLIVGFAYYAGAVTVTGVTDTAGNTYNLGTQYSPGGVASRMFYAENITGHATNVVKVTFSGSATLRSCVVAQYSGVLTSGSLDVEATPTTAPSSGSPTSSAFTTTNANDLIVVAGGLVPSIGAGSGYTLRTTGGTYAGLEDKNVVAIQTGATASFLVAPNGGGAIHVMAFKSAANPVTIDVTDANWYFAPHCWDSTGAGSLAANNVRGSSTFVRTNNSGCYFKTAFVSTGASLTIDTSMITGVFPWVEWSIDNAALQNYQLVSGDSSITLATGLSNAAHTIRFWPGGFDYTQDRWTTPVQQLKITGMVLDTGATSSAPTAEVALQPNGLFVVGDSVTEASNALSNASPTLTRATDGYLSYATGVGDAFSAEVANLSFAGETWGGGSSNVPGCGTSWQSYSNGRSRLVAGKLSPIPTHVLTNCGTNDGGDITSAVQTYIGAMRAAVNSTTPIFIICPLKGTHCSEIQSAITASGDTKTYKIDLGALPPYSISTAGTATRDSFDRIHPSAYYHGRISAMVARAMQAAIGGAATPVTTGYISIQ